MARHHRIGTKNSASFFLEKKPARNPNRSFNSKEIPRQQKCMKSDGDEGGCGTAGTEECSRTREHSGEYAVPWRNSYRSVHISFASPRAPRVPHHWSSGFNSKYIRTSFNTHRQLGNEVIGSPATRARQPFFGEISSRFEFSKAKSGLFFTELKFFDIIILKA